MTPSWWTPSSAVRHPCESKLLAVTTAPAEIATAPSPLRHGCNPPAFHSGKRASSTVVRRYVACMWQPCASPRPEGGRDGPPRGVGLALSFENSYKTKKTHVIGKLKKLMNSSLWCCQTLETTYLSLAWPRTH